MESISRVISLICKFPVEFLVTKQWFIKVLENKNKLHEQTDKIEWKPDWVKARLHNWIDGVSWDWCISRQRFFGIPIPVWYSKRKSEEGKIIIPSKEQLPIDPTKSIPEGYTRDEVEPEIDIFDTWATSSISPQLSTLGITDELNIDEKRFNKLKIPFNLRSQGHDIIRTWAFYTIIKSLYHNKSIPWETIMVNGWCLSSDGTKMSKSVFTKKVVVAAAIVAAFGVTAVAAMKANIIESHTDLRSAVSDIEEIQQMSDDEKLDVKYPDEFTNGYKFDKGYESNDTAVDDEGNVIREYKSFSLDYVKDGKTISLFAEPNADITELPEGYNTVDVNGIEVYTIEAVFKFVPPDYEMTEQDKEDEASGKYVFSYGTDEVEIQTMRQVMWKDGNVMFSLLDSEGTIDMDELVSMAEDVISL